MQTAKDKSIKTILFISIFLVALSAPYACAGPLPGAIFTTLEDGSRVNANIYKKMEDVYLDGGPGQNAPPGSAALPEGWYYFQVTDPSGKVLLSTDPVKCRMFHVNSDGVIDDVNETSTIWKKVRGKLQETDCFHNTGIDIDHAELGAITVQLMPYDRTPNKGGVYKVWITPVGKFVGDENNVDNDGQFHGFVPAWSKTDNYKVKGPPCEPKITVKKFQDSNANGVWDEGEDEIEGWQVSINDPLDVINTYYTPVNNIIALPPGLWTVEEAESQPHRPCDWLPTALIVDGVPLPPSHTAQVNINGECDELHEIFFGNIQLSDVQVCKYHDYNANGERDDDEPMLEGFLIILDGSDVRGEPVHKEKRTDADGCVIFEDLLPGSYSLTEVLPSDKWLPTTPNPIDFELHPEDCEEGLNFNFGNIKLCDVQVCKYHDYNANGERDDGEPPVEGIIIILDGTDVRGEPVHKEKRTDADGCVIFEDLLPGSYSLTEVLPSDKWLPTTPNPIDFELHPEDCEEGLNFNFGNIKLCDVQVCKYHDYNANGERDDGEPPVEGIIIILDGTDVRGEPVHEEKRTDANGCVIFEDLLPGEYTLTEILPPECIWMPTTPNPIDFELDPETCEDAPPFEFGNIKLCNVKACKYHDLNANGERDDDEPMLEGFLIILDGTDVRGDKVHLEEYTDANGCVSFECLLPGEYTLTEILPTECIWMPTTPNHIAFSLDPETCEDAPPFEFGNILLGDVMACKFYDRNTNGTNDDEPPVEGILFLLDGNDVKGDQVHLEGHTDVNGCVAFEGLLPGEYTLTEVLPPGNWEATTDPTVTFDLDPNLEDCEDGLTFEFGNICKGQADFSTKGYWHNKNGIEELTANDELYNDVLNFVHSLNTYDDPSVYYSKGDEPFDGNFADGTPVPAGKGVLENEDIAAEGTKEAEISNFLIESVGDGGIREQLAQQLLAFIFNVHYRIGNDPDVVIYPDGDARSALEIIDCAVLAWSGETDPLCPMGVNETAALLDALNNSDAVDYVSTDPCPVIYGSTFRNFAGMATSWGSAGCAEENNWCNEADINRDGNVNYLDLSAFSEYWLGN